MAAHYLDHKRDTHDALRLVLRFRHIVVQFCVETVQLDLQQREEGYLKIRSVISWNLKVDGIAVCVCVCVRIDIWIYN
jgi:hypothetical protein